MIHASGDRAFTLIELMIVVAIIAIIAAIAVPNLIESRMQANESNAVACLKQYAASQNIYMKSGYSLSNGQANRRYAPSLDNLGGVNAHTNAAGSLLTLVPNVLAQAAAGGQNIPFQGYSFFDQTASFIGAGGAINPQYEYGLYADPALYEKSGINSFHIDTQGMVLQKDLAGAAGVDINTRAAGWVVP